MIVGQFCSYQMTIRARLLTNLICDAVFLLLSIPEIFSTEKTLEVLTMAKEMGFCFEPYE